MSLVASCISRVLSGKNIENNPNLTYLLLILINRKRFMYEHRKQPLASRATFYQRILKNIIIALIIMAVCLVIGIAGYHYWGEASWIDSLHNASMILSGMGPVVEINSVSGKIFSSAYALFSGVIFITNVGVILAPAIHRIFHRLHLDDTK
jgi:hypothetical protein